MASGVYEVRPRGQNDGVVVNAYCDMSTTPAGQSLFDVPDGQPGLVGSSSVWSQSFSLTADTTMMWVDFTGKQYDIIRILLTQPHGGMPGGHWGETLEVI